MATFRWYLNGNLAREVNKLLDWSGKLWSQRYRSLVPLADPPWPR